MSETLAQELAKYEDLGCLQDMFERQVQLSPDNVAVVEDYNQTMTYAELNEACNILADNLVLLGVGPDKPVGIYMERCMEYVISYIAILKAGGCYIPLDVSYPVALLHDILADAQPVCVIVNEKTFGNDLQGQKAVHLYGDWMTRLELENQKVPEIKRPKTKLDDLACIVYSSGTTGKPKGIMNPQRSPVYSYTWRHLSHPYQDDDRVGCNVFFVWEMLRPLLKGIPLYIIPDDVIYDPLLLARFIKRHQITRILFTPSLLETILDATNINMSDFASLRLVWFCGEVVTTPLLERCITNLSWVKFYNLYSISECHDVAVANLNEFWKSVKSLTKPPEIAPVGKLCPGIHVVILDEDNNPKPIGMTGEIFVGGPTLSRGYLNRPRANEKRFVKRPEQVDSELGPRLYRTGDWGLLKSDQDLEICGRCDTMVKIRGYSVELLAVKAALLSLGIVKACVVLALGNEGEDKQLAAYIVRDSDVSKKKIRDQLRLKLPFYMIPAYIMFLESFYDDPHLMISVKTHSSAFLDKAHYDDYLCLAAQTSSKFTWKEVKRQPESLDLPVLAASGKLDKKALPPFPQGRKTEKGQPASKTEEFLESVWKEILQVDFIDVEESFFELGGHSLLAARMLGKIREKYTTSITMQHLFANPTIKQLAALLDSGDEGSSESPVSEPVDLPEEVRLLKIGPVNLDIQLRAFWRYQTRNLKFNRSRIFLTGATGFLGAFLLKELLLNTKAQIYCLVRRSPDKSAEERLQENLEFYDIFSKTNDLKKDLLKAFQRRVQAITGDVALLELGLSEEDYSYLSYEIDIIIHAAAFVNLLYPYEVLKGTNVTGTKNILLFARSGKIKPVHYISTNSVFPNGLTSCKETSSMDVDTKLLENGYSRSKWVAEQLVMSACDQGLPATIYRIGNISGDSTFAAWNPSDFILLVLRASLMTLTWPDLNWHIEMSPVDFVSKSIIKLTEKMPMSKQKIFHIVQANGVTGRWLYGWLKHEFGFELKLVSLDEWCDGVKSLEGTASDVCGHPDVRKMLESLTSSKDPSLFSYNTSFDQTGFLTELNKLEIAYPEINGKLLRTYINQLIKKKLISAPKSARGDILNGRVAIVTGASSGIGRAIGVALAKAGMKVCISARSVDKLKELKSEIEENDGTAVVYQCDVVERDQVLAMVKHVEELWGSVDILVNNAGIMLYTTMDSVKMAEWDKMIDVNCKGVTNGIGAVLPGMIKYNQGHIINISSDAGIKGFPGLAVYSGTKFFVEGMSDAMRHELVDKGIKVTCIQPGDVKTNINSSIIDQEASDKYAVDENMKILDPEDVANAVVFAASQPEHSAVNSILIEPRLSPA